MFRPLRCLRSALLAATMLAPVAARAQDATSDQAIQLQRQLRGWLATLLGPDVALGDKPVHVVPEGDHLRLSLDIAGPVASTPVAITGGPITANAKQLDANRWSIDDVRLPSTWRVDSARPDDTGFASMNARIDEQSSHGIVDTSLATPTVLDFAVRGYSSATNGPGGTSVTDIAGYSSHTVVRPSSPGYVDLLLDGRGEKLATDSVLADGSRFKLTADRLSMGSHARDLALDQIGPVIRSFMTMASDSIIAPNGTNAGAAVPAPSTGKGNPKVVDNAKQALAGALQLQTPAPPSVPRASPAGMTPAKKNSMRQLLAAFRASTGGLDEELGMENIHMEASSHGVTFGKVGFGFGIGSADGKIDAHLAVAMDGFSSPDIPPGPMRDYLPTHIALRPHASGVPSADLFTLLDHAIDTDGKDENALMAEALGLLAKGPLNLGVDGIEVAMGPASLTGGGQMLIASTTDIKGTARFAALGLDELIRQVNATPALQQTGMRPILFMLKGMGRVEGPTTVWDITYADGKVLVNGTDLSSMMPSGK